MTINPDEIRSWLIWGKERLNYDTQVRIVWSHRVARWAGKALCGRNTIKLNRIIFEQFALDKQRNTVLHELAHLVAWDRYRDGGHGNYWKMVMCQLGLPPERCYKEKVTLPGYLHLTCDCGVTFNLSKRMQTKIRQGSYRMCRQCKRRIVYSSGRIQVVEPSIEYQIMAMNNCKEQLEASRDARQQMKQPRRRNDFEDIFGR